MRITTRAALATALLPVALTACSVNDSTAGSGKSGTPQPSATVKVAVQPLDSGLKARVPKEYASRGTLVLGLPEYSPYATYQPDGTIVGLAPDLAEQLSSMLGIKIKVTKTTLDSAIPSIKAGRIDLVAPVGDFVERQQQVDMTDFAQSFVTVMINTSAGFTPKSGMELCGRKVGVEKGAGTQNVVAALSAKCTAGGKPAVSAQVFGDLASAALALQSKRIDAVAAPSASNTAVSGSSGGRFATVKLDDTMSLPAATAIYGIASKKGSGLASVFADAMHKLDETGTYQKLFDKWNLPLSPIAEPKIVVNGSKQSQAK
ncbi:transporter substrate-binding domain-containing protein [Actinoallomurus sp. CA-150999]|uniref:transporter substrate-binding domain-containing protein n=1 Tax=Actinoallomurus sp. CA-150999 TaxID=3239887 RepID=UPI003D921B81